nr:glycine radical domain-containing protein [Candidatus Sigynarchaeum springense]
MVESLTEEIGALKAAMLHRVRPEPGGFRSHNPEALSNSFAPAQGVGREGFTAMCNSAAKIDQTKAIGSCTLNLTLLQSSLQHQEQREKFSHLIQAYFLKGGTHVQVNIFDKATLRDAQKHPEKYPELVVKVGGFSARFIDLETVLQDEIIHRDGFSV